YFGRGNSTGILEVPAGGEIHFGSGADRVSNFRIAYNDAGGGTANADLDLSLTDPTFTADISDDLSIGRVTSNGAAFGSLTLGGNSTVNLGTAAAPATLNLGWNQVTSGFSSGNANGVFDTTVGAFTADLSTLTIARTSNRGSATGQFIMGPGAAVSANVVNVGIGSGASGTLTVLADVLTFTGDNETLNFGTGVLEVPGGAFTVGSSADPVSTVRVGYNSTGAGTSTTAIDFTATDPVFTADVGELLSVGQVTSNGTANGSLALAGNSTLNLGTEAAPAALNLGWNQVTSGFSTGNANGVFEALDRDAEVNLHLGDLNVGVGTTQGSAMGTMKWDQTEVIDATNVYFGRGNSTGILEVPAGGEIHFGSGADRVSNFRIAYNDAGGGTANAD
ncbi:MAG: hypothetical protein GY788_25100, partial [bacterium]|nr:hypothetical protein [bacterium]